MKWGIRKSEKSVARLQRVADGTASRRDKVIVGKTSRQRDIIKARGDSQKVAQMRLDRLKAHQDKKAAKAEAKAESKNKPETPAASATKSSKSSANETSAEKYDRLLAQAKDKGGNSLSDEELRFVNQRADAVARVNRLTADKPSWLSEAAKGALNAAAKKTLKSVATGLAAQYISAPIVKAAVKGK